MIKSYILYDEQNKVTQFTRCDDTEIGYYESNYIETELDDFHFDTNYTYKIINNQVVKTEKTDINYLLQKANKEYENTVNSITASIPQSEISTWAKQESEARAYLLDSTASTPFIDAICLARGIDKSYLVDKIIEKADAYAVVVGMLTGVRQKLEKEITGK